MDKDFLKDVFGAANETLEVAIECMLFAGTFKAVNDKIEVPDIDIIGAAISMLLIVKEAAKSERDMTTEEIDRCFDTLVSSYRKGEKMENWRKYAGYIIED